jgi:hypothetical protein
MRWHWWSLHNNTLINEHSCSASRIIYISLHLKLIVAFLKSGCFIIEFFSPMYRGESNIYTFSYDQLKFEVFKGLNNISSVFWVFWFLFSFLLMQLSWWRGELWDKFITRVILCIYFLLRNREAEIPWSELSLELGNYDSKVSLPICKSCSTLTRSP